MMLLMCREYQVVENFAAAYCAVVTQHRINQPRPVLQIGITTQHKSHSLTAVEYMTAVPDDAVDHLNAFTDLRRLFF